MDEQVENHEEGGDSSKAAACEPRLRRRRTCAHPAPPRWRTPREQRRYASNFLEALRHVSLEGPNAQPKSRAVREATDRALAVAAGGPRWSRTVLAGCRALKRRTRRRAVIQRPAPPLGGAGKKAPAAARKLRVLGRLVPGCRRLLLPSLLEEAADYIAALQMQVRAMSALTETLSPLSGGSSQPDP